MGILKRELASSTDVITGGSSGIGLAIGRAFARQRVSLVLAARAEGPLRQAVESCEALGAAALAYPADVTDPAQMQRLASAAVERFGRIDIWVNDAGMSLWGRFEDIPVEDQNRLVSAAGSRRP